MNTFFDVLATVTLTIFFLPMIKLGMTDASWWLVFTVMMLIIWRIWQ